MKIFSPYSLAMTAILFIQILGVANLRAGASNKSGNPFGNGTFFSTGGTFTGVLRGVDLVGVTQFSTTTNAALTGGALAIYDASQGLYNENLGVYASLDPAANTLTAMILPNTQTALNDVSANIFQGGGSFSATLSTQPPNQTYSGNGMISQVLDSTTPTTNPPVNMSFSITGTRISSQ